MIFAGGAHMGNGKKLSSLDASFLYLETPEMPMHVGSMAIFRLPDDYKGDFFEEFKAMIASRLHMAPILKARLEKTPLDIDHPSWVEDDQFDIDRHIFRASLPAPRDRATLERIVGWMHAKLLNRARPLWEFYVFEGMKDNEIGLYSKMHHACIDGRPGAARHRSQPAGFLPAALEPAARRRRRQIDRTAALGKERSRIDPVRQRDVPDRERGTLCWQHSDHAEKRVRRDRQDFRSEIARKSRHHDVAADHPEQIDLVGAKLCRRFDFAVAGEGARQAIGRKAQRRGAGARLRRGAALPHQAGRAAEQVDDGSSTDLAARGRQRRCQQPGVRHDLLDRHQRGGSQGPAGDDYRAIHQVQGDVASAARADAAGLQYLDAGCANPGADPGAALQPLQSVGCAAAGRQHHCFQRAGSAADALCRRCGTAAHLPGFDLDPWDRAQHHRAELPRSARFRLHRGRQHHPARARALRHAAGGVFGTGSGLRASGLRHQGHGRIKDSVMIEMPPLQFAQTNGIRMGYYDAGPKSDKPPLVLCHGWPELAFSWRYQIKALSEAGIRVIAPDQRGYGATDRPEAVEAYDLEHLTLDLVGLLDHLGIDKAVFVGHDWGGFVVWRMALSRPSRVAGVVGVNTPHTDRAPIDPIELFRKRFGEQMYIVQFQDPAREPDRIFDSRVEETFDAFMREPLQRSAGPSEPPAAGVGASPK